MKSKLFIIVLMLYWARSFGQSVPNTTTFSLQNVVNVTGGTSLTAAFAASVDSYFDPAYKGSKNSLLNFRNYTIKADCTRPIGLITKKLIWGTVCSGTTYYFYNVTPYYGSGGACYSLHDLVLNGCGDVGYNVQATTYTVGDTVYYGIGSDCTHPADGYYIIEFSSTDDLIYHIVNGIITEKLYCYL